mmetsp:Transcript_94445/g.182144  ORF Transcript_94445/g.182144 Transcript_94445/m.182144 type:complete len:266 (+) Transcript_94445:137-934(+)
MNEPVDALDCSLSQVLVPTAPKAIDDCDCDHSRFRASSAAKCATIGGGLRLWELDQLRNVVEQRLNAAHGLAQEADADLAAALWHLVSALTSWVGGAATALRLGVRSAEEAKRSMLTLLEVSNFHGYIRKDASKLAASLKRLARELDAIVSELQVMREHVEYLIECAELQEMEWTMKSLRGTIDRTACKSLLFEERKTCLKAVISLLEDSKEAMGPSTQFWRGLTEDIANLRALSKSVHNLHVQAIDDEFSEFLFAHEYTFVKRL